VTMLSSRDTVGCGRDGDMAIDEGLFLRSIVERGVTEELICFG